MRKQSKNGWFYFTWNHGYIYRFMLELGKLSIGFEFNRRTQEERMKMREKV